MSIFEKEKNSNSGKLLEITKVGWYTIFRSFVTINQSIHEAIKLFLNPSCSLPHPPPVIHRIHPNFQTLHTHKELHTHTHTNSFLTKTPDSSSPDKNPTFQLQNGPFFCHTVRKSSHPVLVREREIYWKRRWNWKQQMSERVCQREMSPTLLPLNKLHAPDWLTLLPQSVWNKWKKKLVKKLSGSL